MALITEVEVVGNSDLPGDTTFHAFLWTMGNWDAGFGHTLRRRSERQHQH